MRRSGVVKAERRLRSMVASTRSPIPLVGLSTCIISPVREIRSCALSDPVFMSFLPLSTSRCARNMFYDHHRYQMGKRKPRRALHMNLFIHVGHSVGGEPSCSPVRKVRYVMCILLFIFPFSYNVNDNKTERDPIHSSQRALIHVPLFSIFPIHFMPCGITEASAL